MRNIQIILSGVVFLGMLVVTACSGAAASESTSSRNVGVPTVGDSGTQQITVTVGNRMSFDPSTITVRAGDPVEVTLRNEGTMPHDFTLTSGADTPVKIAATGGQTASGTFTVAQPGTYAFECSIPGHAAAGMRGTIIAQ